MMPDMNRVYQGDCVELMRSWPDKSIDLVLTDPPYTIHAKSGGGLHRSRKWLSDVAAAGLDTFSPTPFLDEVARVTKTAHGYIFLSRKNLAECIGWAEGRGLNWDLLIMSKVNPIPTKNNKYLPDTELIFFFRGSGSFWNNDLPLSFYRKVKTVSCRESQFGHPTEKPEAVIGELLMVSTREGDLVADPFLGSGTTAVVASRARRNFIGCEINPEFVAIAEKRIAAETEQGRFF